MARFFLGEIVGAEIFGLRKSHEIVVRNGVLDQGLVGRRMKYGEKVLTNFHGEKNRRKIIPGA